MWRGISHGFLRFSTPPVFLQVVRFLTIWGAACRGWQTWSKWPMPCHMALVGEKKRWVPKRGTVSSELVEGNEETCWFFFRCFGNPPPRPGWCDVSEPAAASSPAPKKRKAVQLEVEAENLGAGCFWVLVSWLYDFFWIWWFAKFVRFDRFEAKEWVWIWGCLGDLGILHGHSAWKRRNGIWKGRTKSDLPIPQIQQSLLVSCFTGNTKWTSQRVVIEGV